MFGTCFRLDHPEDFPPCLYMKSIHFFNWKRRDYFLKEFGRFVCASLFLLTRGYIYMSTNAFVTGGRPNFSRDVDRRRREDRTEAKPFPEMGRGNAGDGSKRARIPFHGKRKKSPFFLFLYSSEVPDLPLRQARTDRSGFTFFIIFVEKREITLSIRKKSFFKGNECSIFSFPVSCTWLAAGYNLCPGVALLSPPLLEK